MAAKSQITDRTSQIPSGCCLLAVRPEGFTLVDLSTAERLRELGSPALFFGHHGYVRVLAPVSGQLHRFVTHAGPGEEVHHVNGDKADNRLANLCVLSRADHRGLDARRAPAGRGLGYWNRSNLAGRSMIRVTWQGRRLCCYGFVSAILSTFMRDDLAQALTGRSDGLNFSKSIKQREIRRLFAANRGEPISVAFLRRGDGSVRWMRCRAPEKDPVAPPPSGVIPRDTQPRAAGPHFRPAARGLLSVFDLDRRAYRFIPLENVLCLTLREERIRVLRARACRPPSTGSETSSAPGAGATSSRRRASS